MRTKNIHSNINNHNETLKKKLQNTQLTQINYQLIINKHKKQTNTINIQTHTNHQLKTLNIDTFIQQYTKKITSHHLPKKK